MLFATSYPILQSLQENELRNPSLVRFHGRTVYDPNTRSRVFYHTGSGFEVSFEGTSCQATFLASPSDIEMRIAHVVVWIDGIQTATIRLDAAKITVQLTTNLPNGIHTIRVAKRSEAADSWTAIQALFTDGRFLNPPPAKSRALEIVGASNTCGYGNIGAIGIPKSTANSNGMLGFGYRASELLDWDVSIVGASGWGLTRGYNTGGIPKNDATLPYAYRYPGILPDGSVDCAFGEWNETKSHPDAVLFNLGSNDFNAGEFAAMDAVAQAGFITEFQKCYVGFLQAVHQAHPDAKLVVTYGLTGEARRFGELYQTIAAKAKNLGIDALALELEAAGSNGNAFGSDYHPNTATHENNAWIVKKHIEARMSNIQGLIQKNNSKLIVM